MIDRFLVRIANARSFLSKLWVLAGPIGLPRSARRRAFGARSVTVKESWIARGLLAVIVGLSVLIVYMSKLINAWNARFFNALQDKNAEAFWTELHYWVVLVALFIVAFVYRQWLTQLLTIRWRRWLSEVYFRDWLADRTYYRMELTGQGTDNPEQRIEQDCATFAEQTLTISLGLLLQVMTLITFAAVLWNLSGSFVLPIFGGITVPGYMMWAAIAYALVGSVATYLIGRPLVRVNFQLERYNADFRYRMVRIRENAESIALYRGEHGRGAAPALGASRASSRLGGRCMTYTKRLTWLTSFYGQAASIFPYHRRRAAVFRRQDPAGRADADRRRLRPGAGRALLVRRHLRAGSPPGRPASTGSRPSARRWSRPRRRRRETAFESTPAADARADPARRRRAAAQRQRCCWRTSTSPSSQGESARSCAAPRAAARPRSSACWRACGRSAAAASACRRTRACCSCRRSPTCRSARCARC